MPLCFKYALIAPCGLSSMLFPMAVCLSRAGARPLARLVVRMTPAGKRQRKGGSETRMRPSFPRGAPCRRGVPAGCVGASESVMASCLVAG